MDAASPNPRVNAPEAGDPSAGNGVESMNDLITVGGLEGWDSREILRALNARFRQVVRDALIQASVPPAEAGEWIDTVFVRWARGRAELPKAASVLASLQHCARQVARSQAVNGAARADRVTTCRIRADGFYGSGL